jgi:hypothetical protein
MPGAIRSIAMVAVADRRGVAVDCRGVGQAGRVEVIGRVAGDGAGEDRAQQGGADRAGDLLGTCPLRRFEPSRQGGPLAVIV